MSMINGARVGGVAALYVAMAYTVAIPYFLVVVQYPGVDDPTLKLALLRDHYNSMYAMHVLVYELVAIALVVFLVALHERLQIGCRLLARLATVLGLIWSGLLLASSMVFNYGMSEVLKLLDGAPTHASWMWQVIEVVALGVGGAGGELIGGLWMLTISAAAHVARVLPRATCGLGFVIGAVGLLSCVPAVRSANVVFGVLQIVWFAWVGAFLIRSSSSTVRLSRVATVTE